MQKPVARPRKRRRLQKRSSFRPRQRGLLLSSASKIERSRRQCRNGARKTRFSRLRILRAVGKGNHRRNKRALSTSRNSFGRRVRNGILFVRNHRKRQNDKDVYVAIDISKNAVKICAKRNERAECAVASVYDVPVQNDFADVIVCVFSPFAMEEYTRILKNGGVLILVYPCENHLVQLRKALYENVRDVATALPASSLELVDKKEISYSFNLTTSKQICDLLTMTPYVYRAPKASVENVKSKTCLDLTADFCMCVLKKSSR